MNKNSIIKWVEWAIRINIFIKLFIYGTGKIIGGQFYRKGAIPEEVGNTTLVNTGSYDLAWTFFGHSEGYILFIGISQLLGALLFLLPRTRLLGGALLIPILLNIIAVDWFFGVAYGALFSACFYLAGILWVFYIHRKTVIQAVKQLFLPSEESRSSKKQKAVQWALICLVTALLFGVEFYLIDWFGYDDPGR